LLGYLYTATPLTWSGMEMFFVLSGFLIGGILLDARNSTKYFSTFYVRRFCRILPAYFLFIASAAIAYYFLYPAVGAPLDWVFSGRLPWYAYLLFTQNFWMAKMNASGPPIMAITWSIAVEEQFYLVLPLIIRFVRRSALPYVFTAGIVIAPLVRLFIVYQFRAHLKSTYVLLPCRMDPLFLGALCAYYLREPDVWTWLVKRRKKVLTALSVVIACMPLVSSQGIPFTLLWLSVGIGWMSAFYAIVLILALTNSHGVLCRTMRWKWLAGLGTIGYSVYLFHLGIYCLSMWLFTGHQWLLASWKDFGVTLIALAITIGFCKLSWRYFEKPIVRWGHKWTYEPGGHRAAAMGVGVPQAQPDDGSKKLEGCRA
jgi:peptidoglycan/LPS O-acetylase OafA/YrhL